MWVEQMDSVNWPNTAQLESLHEASKVCVEEMPVAWSDGDATVTVRLEAYGSSDDDDDNNNDDDCACIGSGVSNATRIVI